MSEPENNGKQTGAIEDAKSISQKVQQITKDAKTVRNLGVKAAAGDYVGAAIEVAKNPSVFGKIVLVAIIGGLVNVFLLVSFVIFIIAAPLNVAYYGVQAAGEALTSTTEAIGQNLQVAWYSFMEGTYKIRSGLTGVVVDLLHPIQASEREAIEAQLAANGLPYADEELFPEYSDDANSLFTTLEGAFRHGWAATYATAQIRAKKIVQEGNNVVDTVTGTKLYDDDAFWGDTSNWNPENKSDFYKAGTYFYDPAETYSGQYTGAPTIINISYEGGDISDPSYTYAILQLIALQNSAELTVVKTDVDGSDDQWGVIVDYGEDSELTAAQKAATEYQLLKIGSKVAGQGVLVGDIGTDKENRSIYRIVITPTVTKTTHSQEVQKRYLIGYEQGNPIYLTHEEYNEETGEWEIVYDTDPETGEKIIIGYEQGPPIYEWRYDHTEFWVEVNAKIKYEVQLRPDTMEIMKAAMLEKMNPDEQAAFNESIASFYQVNYETLCGMFRVEGDGSDVDDSGFVADPGYFSWPLPMGVGGLSRYYNPGHKGLDWWAPAKTAIFAAADGTVVSAGWSNSWGYNVLLQHDNGTQTRYAHMFTMPFVSAGQTVTKGQLIGGVGTTGNSTGNHLHLELIIGGERVDPLPSIPIPPHGPPLFDS